MGSLLLFNSLCVSLFFAIILAQENIPWYPRACVNCHGYRARPGELYFDGCNVCKCHRYLNRAMCTRRRCRWNECFEIEREEPEGGYGNGYHSNRYGYNNNGNGYRNDRNGYRNNGNGYQPDGNGYENNDNGFYDNGNSFDGNGYGSSIG